MWPCYSEDEIAAVTRVLQSNKVNYWTGNEGREFEKEFANWVGVEYAVAVANGTLALDAILKISGIGPGDEVIVTSRTFIASVSCIMTVGATPVFADVDLDSQNITVKTIQSVMTEKTRAILCVHLAGWPCDMPAIMQFAKQYNLLVFEDCAQAHGAKIQNQSVGSFGHMSAWSFCQDKIMTTGGEGGMITTNDPDLWKKLWAYKDHGKSWDAVHQQNHPAGFRWLVESFGSNFRMLEIQAVIGRLQLKKMAEWNTTRLKYANLIWQAAREIPGLRVPTIPADVHHAAYKCYVFIRPELLKWDRDKIIAEINQRGVACFSGSCSEVYLEKAFDNTSLRPEPRLPNAKRLGETSLMFLVHPTLAEKDVEKCIAVLKEVMQYAYFN